MKVLRFNQDATFFSVYIHPNSLSIFNCDPFGKCFEFENIIAQQNKDIYTNNNITKSNDFIAEMLFATNLVAIVDKTVNTNKKRSLKIVNIKRKSIICELTFVSEIMNVVMNRKRMCVLVDTGEIFIYDISCMKLLKSINTLENESNPIKINHRLYIETKKIQMCLSNDNVSILCYTTCGYSSLNSHLLGDLVIFDALKVKPLTRLSNIHENNIACIEISHDGQLVATASERGTIIRVFDTDIVNQFSVGGRLVCEYRRGTKPSSIYELKFDFKKTLLACIGTSNTLHIFRVDPISDNALIDHHISKLSYKGDYVKQESLTKLTKLIPQKLVSKVHNQNIERCFAYIKIKYPMHHCLGFPYDLRNALYLVSDNGQFQVFNIPNNGGECTLVKDIQFK